MAAEGRMMNVEEGTIVECEPGEVLHLEVHDA
jgi:hypothetical protein